MEQLKKTTLNLLSKFKKNYNSRKNILRERGLRPYIFNNSGYVLIIVLIVTTLLVSIAGEFIVVTQTNIGYIRKLTNRLKAGYLAKSGVQLAKIFLYIDSKGVSAVSLTGKKTNKNVDSYNDIWAINLPEIPMGDGSLDLQIEDENSKINLSILAPEGTEKTKYYFFTRLFFMNMGQSMDIADVIHDWVDIDDSRMPFGAESSDYYQNQIPPYSAKNNAMDSIDELLLVKGITPKIFYGLDEEPGMDQDLVEHNKGDNTLDMEKITDLMQGSENNESGEDDEELLIKIGKEKSRKLSDYFTVYGDRRDYMSDLNKININTASFRVLSALTEKMTPDIVTEIINRRQATPYTTVDEIKTFIDDETIRKVLSVKSNIFKIKSRATIDNYEVSIITIYNRRTRRFLYWCEE